MSFVASAPEPQVEPQILLVTTDDALAEEVAVLSESVAAALLRLRSLDGHAPAHRRMLAGAALVLLDDGSVTRWGADRDQVVLLRPDAAMSWAVDAGGLEQVMLPSGRDRLLELLAAAARPPAGPLVGVLGASGGVGATTLAVALAVTARPHSVLVDADPVSAGLDSPLGGEAAPGLRWADLAGHDSPLPGEELVARLPGRDRVRWLSSRVSDLDPPAAPVRRTVLRAARAGAPGTVVDLGRGHDPLQVAEVDAVLVLAAADVAGMVAATRAVQRCQGLGRTVGVVLGRRPGADLSVRECRAVLSDVVTELPQVRGLAADADRGRLLEAVARRLRAPAQHCLEWVRDSVQHPDGAVRR